MTQKARNGDELEALERSMQKKFPSKAEGKSSALEPSLMGFCKHRGKRPEGPSARPFGRGRAYPAVLQAQWALWARLCPAMWVKEECEEGLTGRGGAQRSMGPEKRSEWDEEVRRPYFVG